MTPPTPQMSLDTNKLQEYSFDDGTRNKVRPISLGGILKGEPTASLSPRNYR